jgi:hypothetical protein
LVDESKSSFANHVAAISSHLTTDKLFTLCLSVSERDEMSALPPKPGVKAIAKGLLIWSDCP